jgi:hypothetical protein
MTKSKEFELFVVRLTMTRRKRETQVLVKSCQHSTRKKLRSGAHRTGQHGRHRRRANPRRIKRAYLRLLTSHAATPAPAAAAATTAAP